MTNQDPSFKIKKDLYTLYYELSEILTKHQLEISKEELSEKIESSSITQLSNYIKTLVHLVLKQSSKPSQPSTTLHPPLTTPESLLRHLEKENRNLYQQVFELKFQLEIYQSSIEEYVHMEEEFEEMKQKFKYEGGKFLDNDRKDNEILILRAENTNLKQLIKSIESTSEEYKLKQKENETLIEKYKNEISTLKSKLQGAENELNLFSNISININNHNELTSIHSPLNSNKANAQNISIKKLKADKPIKQKQYLRHRNNSLSNLLDNQKLDIYNKYFSNKTNNTSNKKHFADTYNTNIMNHYKNGQKCLKIKKMPFGFPKSNSNTTYGQFKQHQIQYQSQKNVFQSGNHSNTNNNNFPNYLQQQFGNAKESMFVSSSKHSVKNSTQRYIRNNSGSVSLIKGNYKYASASFG